MPRRRPCRTCKRNRAEHLYVSARGRVCRDCRKGKARSYNRSTHLLETYGLTQDEYQTILDAQGGVCAICGGERKYFLHVDHSHRSGLIRGLLCKACNKRLLPAARDSVAVLQSAIDYLESNPAFAVLGSRCVPTSP